MVDTRAVVSSSHPTTECKGIWFNSNIVENPPDQTHTHRSVRVVWPTKLTSRAIRHKINIVHSGDKCAAVRVGFETRKDVRGRRRRLYSTFHGSPSTFYSSSSSSGHILCGYQAIRRKQFQTSPCALSTSSARVLCYETSIAPAWRRRNESTDKFAQFCKKQSRMKLRKGHAATQHCCNSCIMIRLFISKSRDRKTQLQVQPKHTSFLLIDIKHTSELMRVSLFLRQVKLFFTNPFWIFSRVIKRTCAALLITNSLVDVNSYEWQLSNDKGRCPEGNIPTLS